MSETERRPRGRASKRRNAKARRQKRAHSKQYNRAWTAAQEMAKVAGHDWSAMKPSERRAWRDRALV